MREGFSVSVAKRRVAVLMAVAGVLVATLSVVVSAQSRTSLLIPGVAISEIPFERGSGFLPLPQGMDNGKITSRGEFAALFEEWNESVPEVSFDENFVLFQTSHGTGCSVSVDVELYERGESDVHESGVVFQTIIVQYGFCDKGLIEHTWIIVSREHLEKKVIFQERVEQER